MERSPSHPDTDIGNRNSKAEAVREWAIGVLIVSRLAEFSRKPAAVFWTYVFPLVMMLILGSAFQSSGDPVTEIGLVEFPGAESITRRLEPHADVSLRVVSAAEGRRLLRSGQVAVLIESVQTGGGKEPIEIDLLYDPSRSGSRLAEMVLRQKLDSEQPSSVQIQVKHFEEPGGRYIDFLIPGLIGMTLLGGGLWGVGYGIVDMRIRKLLKRYLATPMRRSDFLLGIVFSRLLFMFPQVALILTASYAVFSVTIYGVWWEVFCLILLGGLQFAGVGLLVASRAKTMETMSGLINLTMLPMWTLSGIFFSYQNFPEAMHWPIRLLPLTPLLDALRGVMLDGRSLWAFPVELSLILLWTGGTFAIALLFFRWHD